MRSLVVLFLLNLCIVHSQENQPIFDVHLHAYPQLGEGGPPAWACEEAREIPGVNSAEDHLSQCLALVKKHNIVMTMVCSPSIEALSTWKNNSHTPVLTGIQLNNQGLPAVSPDSLAIMHDQGQLDVLGELGLQYHGIAPDDPRMDDYYRVASENGIPVALHSGLGPPGGPHSFAPDFRTTLGKPSLFEPVLVKYPKMKAWLMHAGWPYIEETIALMYVYPELYVDIGVLTWALPEAALEDTLKKLIDYEFGKRIMFGTDQMIWPGAIEMAVNRIKEAGYLTEEQKRDILYNNAARFFELKEEVIAEHHNR